MQAKNRRSAGELLIGIHSVASALHQRPDQLIEVLVTQNCKNLRVIELVEQARIEGISLNYQSRSQLDKVAEDNRHQDIVAWFDATNIYSEKQLAEVLDQSGENPLLLILDGIQDPHNLGACLRTAEAAGVAAVIYPKDKSTGLTPVARRSNDRLLRVPHARHVLGDHR